MIKIYFIDEAKPAKPLTPEQYYLEPGWLTTPNTPRMKDSTEEEP
ncbi:hypothetical protein ['Camptotheca acuminata' phytoplasma]